MRKIDDFLLSIFLFVLICVPNQILFAQNNPPSNSKIEKTEAEKWREDLLYMAKQMPEFHNNLFHKMTREQFDGAVKKLYDRIPTLARHQIIVEMERIVAMVGDGHTNIYPTRDPKIGFRVFPVKTYFFKDGLFIRSADNEHADIVGSRIVKIGNATAEQAYNAVREIVGQDNEMDARFFAAHLLVMPEILHALGLIENMESAKFTIESRGQQRVIELKPIGAAEMMPSDTDVSWLPKAGWVDARSGSGSSNAQAPPPLWLKDPQNKFWYEYLPASRTVYVQYNQVGNKDNETLEAFSKRLFDFVDANPVDKFILDMRLNRGGNGLLNSPFLMGIVKSGKINQKGRLFTIIGRSTFSAAQFMVNDLEKYTNTIFVGEPSGSKGNIYGDSRKIFLPNSGITVRVSVYYWQDWVPWDTRLWTAPDLTAELTSEDYRLNDDPAMKAILNYVPRKSLSEVLDESLTKGGIDLAVKSFGEFMAEPGNRYAATEEPLLEAGQRLLNENKPEQAAVLFQMNAEKNPYSFRAYSALGEAYFQIGKKDLAVANFEKSLQIHPKNYDVVQRLKEVKGN